MRHIILDTETTGLNAIDGHRIIEIGAVEMVDFSLTGEHLQIYINPECEIEQGALDVHNITAEFLADKPVFADIVQDFLDFIGDDELVIHNAPFDIGFLNAELKICNHRPLSMDRVTDTLLLARKKFPGSPASLDALCRRFQIDNSHRTLHGALLDADLLAAVFVELRGGRQPGLFLQNQGAVGQMGTGIDAQNGANGQDVNGEMAADNLLQNRPVRPARKYTLTEQEHKLHTAFIDSMNNPIWRQ